LLVTVPIILDQAVSDCSHYFGSGCWLLTPSFWIELLVTLPILWIRLLVPVRITLDQAVG
jgi:hypothetical protein